MRLLIPCFLPLLFACASEEGVKIYNSEPTASITSHSDGAEFLEGVEYTFVGQVTDTNHASADLLVVWSTDTRELCPQTNPDANGETVCRATLYDADAQLKLQVTDPEGAAVLSSISIDVVDTQAPTIELISPVLNGTYYSDQLIHFSATIQDTEDAPTDLTYSWESNLDGVLPLSSPPTSEGLISGYLNLSEGQHAISLLVEDTTGKSNVVDLAITVGGENNSPACEILTPEPGSGYVVGQNIDFTAMASDEDIDNNQLSISWESDIDGEFNTTSANTAGELTVVYDGLSIGNHIVTLTVEDDVGATCSDTVAVAVGTPPTLTLVSPLSGDVFTVGDSVSFSGTVEDQEDVPSDITISWVSDIDGEFSTQGSDSSGNIAFGYGGLSAGQHNLTITATDSDGLTALVAQSIRINTPPDAPEVVLNPQNPYTTDGIFAIATGSDPDGDTVTFAYEWFSNFGGSYTGSSLPSSETAVGEVWTLTVTPNDGTIDGVSTTVTVTIANTEPTLSNVYVTPNSTVYNDSVLTCAGTASDADETLTPNYIWNVGTDIYTGSTLDLSTTAAMPNDTVTCTVSVEDSNGGSATETASVSVSNRDPLLSGLALSESMVYTSSSVSCSGTIADNDGETPSYSVEWSTASGVLSTSESITLDASMVSVGDALTCTMLVEDGFGGTVSDTVSTTILNTEPTIDSVTLTPLSPNKHETLVCSATAADIDGGTPTLSFAWSNLTTGLTYTSTATDVGSAELDLSTVSAIAPEDEVQCVVTATDADGGSATQVETVEIVNSTPVFDSPAGISPNTSVVTNTQLTCSAVVTDPDDGSLTPTYEWFIGTMSMGTGATYTVFASDTDVGDTITCVATAVDSDGETVSSSADIVVENTDPVASSIGIDNTAPFADDTITCAASATDVDAETLTTTYEWMIGSNLVGSAASLTLTPTMANVGDNVVCMATVTDGYSGSDSISSTVTVQNTDPIMSAVSISPSTATVTDLLTCSATGTDLNDGALSPVYAWTNQNTSASLGSAATLQLDASIASPDDVISCTVAFTDNNSASISDSANLTIINTAPIFDDNAAITPSTGVYTGTELTCSASASDADDGIITPTYEWSVGTATIGSGETYTVSASDTDVGDSIVCTATATDSDSETAMSTSTVVVENTAPVLSGTAIDLSTIYNDDTVVCSSSVVDPDESLSISYEWSIDGVVLGSSASLDLGTTAAMPEDTLVCTASVTDTSNATDSETASGSIGNRLPGAPTISIAPTDPIESEDDLTCSVDVGAVDLDGNSLSYSYAWSIDNVLNTSYTTSTISALNTTAGELWTCTVTPNDGIGDGTSASDTVTIQSGQSIANCPTTQVANEAQYMFVGEEASDIAAYDVSSAGDVDGDGLDDLLIGAYGNDTAGTNAGKAYLILGSSLGSTTTIDLSQADYIFVGEEASDLAGYALSTAGDVDGDGKDDIIIGARYNDAGGSSSGKVYVILASSLGNISTINLSQADYSFIGENPSDNAGIDVSSAGDVDGDGKDDILIGAYLNDQGGTDAGKTYLILGSSLGTLSTIDLSQADYSFVGEEGGDMAGLDVSSAGDVDGDGKDDILFNAQNNDQGGSNAGKAYLILGSSLGSSSTIDLSQADYSFVGENETDYLRRVSTAGDVDGDGKDDIILGARGNDDGGSNVGKAYVILGSSLGSTSTIDLSQADYSFIGEDADDYAGYAVSDLGDVDGDGKDDIIIGAYGNEDGGNNAGKAYVILGSSLGSTSTINLSQADYSFIGEADSQNLGHWKTLDYVGDVNGDGKDDILMGAYPNNDGGSSAGKAYLFLGCE